MIVSNVILPRVRNEHNKLIESQPVVVVNASGSEVTAPTTNLFYNDSTSVLGISATFTGTSRDLGVVAGSLHSSNYFKAFVLTDQIGVLSIECSNNGSTWYTMATSAVAISVPLLLSVPVLTRYHRVKLVNGITLQTSLIINSGYIN